MTEQEIFSQALEIQDSQSREEFLHQQCQDDAELLARVKKLLQSHDGNQSFLNVPVVEQIEAQVEPSSSPTMMMPETDDSSESSTGETDQTQELQSQQSNRENSLLHYLEPATRADAIGRLGHYEILEVIGKGGFGTVLKAFDQKLERIVAIKVLAPEMAATSPARKRFSREARASAQIRHENVVSIYAVEDQPIPYLVMEYIPGETLQDRLDGTGPLEIVEVLRLGKQIAEGLAAAHEQGLIHRDIKPGNVLLETSVGDHVKISDFGLARAADDASMTQSGMIAGTPMYMAPEQAMGATLDHRTDLFSLGSVLYQMVSGRPPFRASNTVAVLKRVCEDTPRSIQEIIPETPKWLTTIIFKLLEKNCENRYQSAREVADLLAQCLVELESTGVVKCVDLPQRNERTKTAPSKTAASAGTPRKKAAVFAGGGLLAILVLALLWKNNSTPNLKQEGELGKATAVTPELATEIPIETVATTTVDVVRRDAPPLATAPCTAEEAKRHQKAWADYLGVPVEQDIVLGKDKNGNDVNLTMMLIPPGEFMMGATDQEKTKWFKEGKAENPKADMRTLHMEGPRHFVRITKPFWLSKYEMTNSQFERFVESTGYQTETETNGKGATRPTNGGAERKPELNWRNWSKFTPNSHPVVNVSWHDATECCEWMTAQNKGLKFSLPTEAQWEFACRAGTKNTTLDCDTEEELRMHAQFGNEVFFIKHVGQLKPNAFGLCDMLGNVTEWCADWIEGYDKSLTNDPSGPISAPEEFPMRAARGGSYLQSMWKVRSSRRDFLPPSFTFFDRGFRVAAAIVDSDSSDHVNQLVNGQAVDLIKLLDPARDFRDGRMKVEDGKLITPTFKFPGAVGMIPFGSLPKNYDVDLQLERISDSPGAGFNMGIVVGGKQVAVGMDCGSRIEGRAWGLDFLDGNPGNKAENMTHNPGERFNVGEISDVTIQVRNNHVTAVCDGETLIDWTGDPQRLSVWNKLNVPESESLFFVAQADFVVHKMELILRGRSVDASSSVTVDSAHQTLPRNEWIDILSIVDPQADSWDVILKNGQKLTGRNEWKLEDGELKVGFADQKPSKIVFPIDADWTAYEFDIEFTRKTGDVGLTINLPTSNHDCPLSFASKNKAGLLLGDHRHPQIMNHGLRFENGKKTQLKFIVRRGDLDQVSVSKDGDKPIEWTGKLETLALNNEEGYDHSRRSSLFVGGGSEFVFHRIRVRMSTQPHQVDRVTVTDAQPHDGKTGLQFDGDGDYLETGLKVDRISPLTIEAVIQMDEWPDVHQEIVADMLSEGGISLSVGPGGFNLAAGVPEDRIQLASVFSSQDDGYLKRPVVLSGVIQSDSIKLFVDGELVAKQPVNFAYRGSTTNVFIGAGPRHGHPGESSGLHWKGKLYALRISNVARYNEAYTPKQDLQSDENTLVLYHFDDGAGDVIKDASVNGHDGRIVGAKWVATNRPGLSGSEEFDWSSVWPKDAPSPAIAPFDAEQAKAHQEAWAKHLGVPVGYENSIGMKFQLIPPGEFLMGSLGKEALEGLEYVDEAHRKNLKSESPQHLVRITQPFYLGETEITQMEYERITGKNPAQFSPRGHRKKAVAGRATQFYPVENVTWHDAAEFTAKLSQREKLKPFYARSKETVTALNGNGYRLPTEAEWEFACRAGTTTRFWCGEKEESLKEVAWIESNSDNLPHAVAKLKENPFHLYDMHGNVWEWVQDSRNLTFYERSSASDFIDPYCEFFSTSEQAMRGGAWHDSPAYNRSAFRGGHFPLRQMYGVGFRVALTVDAVKEALDRVSEQSKLVFHEWHSGEWIDILPLIDAAQDKWDVPALTGKNQWQIQSGELLVGHADNLPNKILFPLDVSSADLECEIEFTRKNGSNGFLVLLPNSKSDLPVAIASEVALGTKDKYIVISEAPLIETGNCTTLRVELRHQGESDRLSVSRDGEEFAVWTGNRNQIPGYANKGYPGHKRIGIFTLPGDSEFVFHKIRVRMLNDGTAKTLRPMPISAMPDGGANTSKNADLEVPFRWPNDAPAPAIAPFNAEQAKAHQEAWAKHLGIPVEYENSIGMKFRLIPPGEFMMGSTKTEIEEAKVVAGEDPIWMQHILSEGPQHKVVLTDPIYLGVHEVTQAQYAAIAEHRSHFSMRGSGAANVFGMDTNSFPVETVSWNDAIEFCKTLSEQERGEDEDEITEPAYQLPSEALWEFACRAGTNSKFYIGDDEGPLLNTAWYKKNSDERTHPVGELQANSFGLFDMHGNVWEWVQDRWSVEYYQRFVSTVAVNPTGPGAEAGSRYGLRGGDWADAASSCRSSHRHVDSPTARFGSIGFRVTLSVEAVQKQLE